MAWPTPSWTSWRGSARSYAAQWRRHKDARRGAACLLWTVVPRAPKLSSSLKLSRWFVRLACLHSSAFTQICTRICIDYSMCMLVCDRVCVFMFVYFRTVCTVSSGPLSSLPLRWSSYHLPRSTSLDAGTAWGFADECRARTGVEAPAGEGGDSLGEANSCNGSLSAMPRCSKIHEWLIDKIISNYWWITVNASQVIIG